MDKRVTFGQLRRTLESLGYRINPTEGDHLVFGNPNRNLLIILRGMNEEEVVRTIDLRRVKMTLVDDGVIKDDDEFDSLLLIRKGDRLIWTDPKTGKETKVTAAAGESDGLVVVKQNGSLLPCQVDQVRRVKRAATASRK
jgi:hypothetical protein